VLLVRRYRAIVLLALPTVLGAQASGTATLDSLLAQVEHCDASASFDRLIAAGRPPEHLPQVSRGAWEADANCWRAIGAGVARVDMRALSAEERLTVQVLRWESGMQQQRAAHWWVDFSSITPYSSPLGYLARALAAIPVRTPADTTALLRLLREVTPLVDSMTVGLEQRAARNVRLAREALPASVALLRGYGARGASNPFAVDPSRLTALDERTRRAVLSSASRIVDEGVAPAVDRLLALLTGPYAAAAPDAVGLATYPGGDAYYRWLVRWHTTLETTPAEVHAIGLAEVARIEREMLAIRKELGFSGTQREFHAQLALDPRFFAKTPEEFGERLMRYAARLDPLLDRAFSRRPRAPGDVRRLPAALEPAMTFGYYQTPTVSDSVGHYYYNGTQLAERTLLTAAPLIAHELWPGHHFQINLARENTALPPYRRGNYTAYSEGWGDYASIVAGELGLYADPWDRYGRLAMDMFISCRLVVDTGMNALGWSRARAMEYMRDHVLESETQIRTESLRYSTDLPGQALAYKMGSREFERLRRRAESTLGGRFDLRTFHDQLLTSGSLPMSVLGTKIDGWLGEAK
jgi:uncharacterized protein (DUF885 family)